jgi:hypothetical protein
MRTLNHIDIDTMLRDHRGPQRPLWPLPYVERPTLRILLPDGTQTQLPGTDWANLDAWMISADRSAPPPICIRLLERAAANPYLARWHDLGAETRPYGRQAFGLYFLDELLAIATSGTTVSAGVDRDLGLARTNTIELTRLCRSPEPRARGLLRAMLRLWRDLLATAYPPNNSAAAPTDALVSYSLPNKHGGDLYRFDGWLRLRDCKPWAGGGTRPSAARDRGVRPQALWSYPLTDEMALAFRQRKLELARGAR